MKILNTLRSKLENRLKFQIKSQMKSLPRFWLWAALKGTLGAQLYARIADHLKIQISVESKEEDR